MEELEFNSPEEILNHIETQAYPYDDWLERSRLFREAARMFAARGDPEATRRCCAENVLFGLHAREPGEDDQGRRYLHPMVEMGSVRIPDPDSIPDIMLEYFRERLAVTNNHHIKARYADFLWDRTKNHEYARASIDAHLVLVQLEADQDRHYNAANCARRALSLAYSLSDKALTDHVVQSLTDTTEGWVSSRSDPDSYLAIELTDKILANRRFRDRAILDQLARVLERLGELSDNHWTSIRLLDELMRVYRRLGRAQDANRCQIQIAEAWEAHGKEEEARSWLVAANSYQDALKVYAEAGWSHKVKEMKRKIRECYQKAEESELKPISQLFEVDMTDWDTQISEWLKLEAADALRQLAAYLPLIPSWQAAEAQTTRLEKEAPLSQLIPRVTVEDGRPISLAVGDEERRFENVRSQYNFGVIGIQVYLSRAIGKLREHGALSAEALIDAIKESPFFDEEKIAVLQRGFERYAEGDNISAIHILVPHLEDCLRRLLGKLGADVISVRGVKMREKPLEEVLESQQMKAILAKISDKLWRYFEHVLVAETGMNLRNNVAHGLLSREESNEGIANTVVHLYLILGLFTMRDDE